MKIRSACILLIATLVPDISLAARAWLLPSQTIIARNGGWVTFDAANADDLFSFNQGAMPLDGLTIVSPDGAAVIPQNPAKGRTRSSFDLELRTPGTYRVAVASEQVMARWEEDGKPKRWRGNAADMAANVPANATKLELELARRRAEAFVTVGSPTPVKPVGTGLELLAVGHPNDLYAGEPAQLRLMLDGKPAADVEVEIIAGGTRYRDSPAAIVAKSDSQGALTVTWPAAGLYWLNASVKDENANVPGVRKRSSTYNATLEVLPQ